jgi:membrane-anchored glycerophosphoryl diester phosphodiesterase (GDPDase)
MVLIVMWFLMSVFISIEQFGTYSILHASFTGQKNITAREAFDNAVDILVRNMRTSFFLLMLYILFLYPFSDLLNTSSITRFFTMPGFITEHFEKYPLIGAGYNLLTLVLGMGALRLEINAPA